MTVIQASRFWLVFVVAASVAATLCRQYWLNILIFLLLFHAGHELTHRSLFPRRLKAVNDWMGVIVFALYFHNFHLLRLAHLEHHKCGRSTTPHCMLDRKYERYNAMRYLEYYAALFGLNYWTYLAAGFVSALAPSRFDKYAFPISRRFQGPIRLNQFVCVAWAVFVIAYVGPRDVLIAHAMFGIIWGVMQNFAHYGLPVGDSPIDRIASRTYGVPAILHFILFGSTFSHLEHHVFPRVPGVRLNDPAIARACRAKLGVVAVSFGLRDYLGHLIQQFRSPNPSRVYVWHV